MSLGVSINLILLAIFKQLGLRPPELTTMRLLLNDHKVKKLVGISFDLLVKVEHLIFPADFFILDCEVDFKIPIILGRPFMATTRKMVDMEKRELWLRVMTKKSF